MIGLLFRFAWSFVLIGLATRLFNEQKHLYKTDGSRESGSKLKEKIETFQAIVTILAIFVGALWTYVLFIKERQLFPHANIEQSVSHVALSDDSILLRVAVVIDNTGTTRLLLGKSVIRIQQILPVPPCPKNGPCAKDEVKSATTELVRQKNVFTWPLLVEREDILETPVEIEPGEKDFMDFEFALSNEVQLVRIYTFFRNDKKTTKKDNEFGWRISSYYDLRSPKE